MKSKKKTKFLCILIMLLLLATSGFLIYNMLLLKGIETFYRIMLIILIGFFDIIIIKSFFTSCLLKYKKGKFILLTLITVLIILIYGIASGFIYIVYSKLDNFNKDQVTYSSSILTLTKGPKSIKSLKNKKIGIVNNTDDIEGYTIPKEIIKKNSLEDENELIEYEDAIEMMKDLYSKELDAIFISSNYAITFESIEGYEKIATQTKVIYEKSKTKKKEEEKTSEKSLNEPFTMLLLGVDSEKNGLNASTSFNGDTIMLITFNPKTLNLTMFSIPRDTYVPIACNGNRENKINSASYWGSKCMIDTVENLTGVKIDYYTKINFKGVVQLVNALGGVNVDVPMKFCEQNSNRAWGSSTICLNKGKQHLNGEQALALARHRKTLPTGDFQRAQNQQLVVEAMMQQLKTVKNAKAFYDILDAISKNIDTNLTTEQLLSFYNIGKKMLFSDDASFNIQKTYLSGYDLTIGGLYTFQYYKGSLKDIVDVMNINLGKKEQTPVKEFDFSINKEYERYIAGKGFYSETRRTSPDVANTTTTKKKTEAIKEEENIDTPEQETSEDSGTAEQSGGESASTETTTD